MSNFQALSFTWQFFFLCVCKCVQVLAFNQFILWLSILSGNPASLTALFTLHMISHYFIHVIPTIRNMPVTALAQIDVTAMLKNLNKILRWKEVSMLPGAPSQPCHFTSPSQCHQTTFHAGTSHRQCKCLCPLVWQWNPIKPCRWKPHISNRHLSGCHQFVKINLWTSFQACIHYTDTCHHLLSWDSNLLELCLLL